jgi:6-pyruvoyltetrahydropterin/6-carboxytetrahydropterin synthase
MLSVTRRVKFCAAHRLYNPEFSDEENDRTFGICNNPAGHGHNYVLEVTVGGQADPRTGMIIDLKRLKDLLEREITSKLDHKNLNVDVEFMRGCVPTAEMLATRIWDLIEKKLPAGKLLEVKVYESEDNIATRSS